MDFTNTTVIVLTIIATLMIGGWIGVTLSRAARTKRLQKKFGPEYDHAVAELGDASQAENELAIRLKHIHALDIHPLSAEAVENFTAQWQENQVEFVDDPLTATQQAYELISDVMLEKGYPVEDFEQQAADISVDYPELVKDFRGLHSIIVKDREKPASTEEMRRAMLHGRDLFNRLIQNDEPVKVKEVNRNDKEKLK